ncbi:glucose-1-phosphate adenylyltransferase [Chloroflexi bacterium TSY]|nr:glucose-1-phosphate adenylyltransferase [Chloroflexi bacterium TSY]
MKITAMILAGGEGTRLTVLSEQRAKPAVPFAGKFRIIDFTISNCVNSGIYTIGVLTQYRPHSLNDHIGIGKPWDLDRSQGGIRLLQPYWQRERQQWYAGTADAIFQNLEFIENQRAEAVLVLSGDHIYKMDYTPMLRHHQEKGADLTIAVMPVPIEEAHRFGIMKVDDDHRIVEFAEKPKEPTSNLASMGIYIFNMDILEKRLVDNESSKSRIDFGKDVIPAMLGANDRVFAYQFDGYWVDVGTLDSYWETNLDLLRPESALNLYTDNWPIYTRSEELPAVKLDPQAKVVQSMLCNGCIIRGLVHNSILSPGVYVSPGAVVRDSVIMNDTWIGPGVYLEKVVIDKQVVIGPGAVIGPGDETVANEQMPDKLNRGITVVGKGATIPNGARIGRNVLINSERQESDYPENRIVADGQTI